MRRLSRRLSRWATEASRRPRATTPRARTGGAARRGRHRRAARSGDDLVDDGSLPVVEQGLEQYRRVVEVLNPAAKRLTAAHRFRIAGVSTPLTAIEVAARRAAPTAPRSTRLGWGSAT